MTSLYPFTYNNQKTNDFRFVLSYITLMNCFYRNKNRFSDAVRFLL